MSESGKVEVPGGNPGAAGGQAENQNSNVKPSENQSQGSVDYATYSKLLDEHKGDKRKLKEMQEAQLKEQNNLKGLLEIREKELADRDAKLAAFEQKEIKLKREQAFKAAFNKPLEEKWLQLVKWDSILVDPNTGVVDPRSVELEAKRFDSEWGKSAFATVVTAGAQQNSPAAVQTANGKLTLEEYEKLSDRDKIKRYTELFQ